MTPVLLTSFSRSAAWRKLPASMRSLIAWCSADTAAVHMVSRRHSSLACSVALPGSL